MDELVDDALARAVEGLLARQGGDGSWECENATDVSVQGIDVIGRTFLQSLSAEDTASAARWIRSQQRDDGGWPAVWNGPSDVSGSVTAYAALRIAGDDPSELHMAAARTNILAAGGIEAMSFPIKLPLALLGLVPWLRTPALPPEVAVRLRPSATGKMAISSAGLAVFVPISIITSARPVLDVGIRLEELWTGCRRRTGLDGVAQDGAVHLLRPPGPRRRRAYARAAAWVAERQVADGSFAGMWASTLYSAIALRTVGGHDDAVARAVPALDALVVRDDAGRRVWQFSTTVCSTAMAIDALGGPDVLTEREGSEEAASVQRACDWLVAQQNAVTGTDHARGGWSYEPGNPYHPDTDTTAAAVIGLARAGRPDRAQVSIDGGLDWMTRRQAPSGGWSALEKCPTWITRLPGRRMLDKMLAIELPSADVTAHALVAYAEAGQPRHPAALRGLEWLRRTQRADGSWPSRWASGYVWSTASVLAATSRMGIDASDDMVGRALGWLRSAQNLDGGWGSEAPISIYPARPGPRRAGVRPGPHGPGASTIAETASALTALVLYGVNDAAVSKAMHHLLDRQDDDGLWDDPSTIWLLLGDTWFFAYPLAASVLTMTALAELRRLRSAAVTALDGSHRPVAIGG